MNKAFWIGVLVITHIASHAQILPDLAFQNINIWEAPREGHAIVQILEDHEGYLWMTSSMGVYRYDGRTVHSYFHQADTTAISDNYNELLYEDSKGNIWIGSLKGGLDRYRRDLDIFERIIHSGSELGHLHRMTEDPDGQLWISSGTGLFLFDPHTLQLTSYIPDRPPKGKGYGFRALLQDVKNAEVLWVGGLDGAYQFDKTTGRFRDLGMPAEKYMMMDLHQPTAEKLWGGSWFGGVICFDQTTSRWQNYIPDIAQDGRWHDVVKSIMPLDRNRFWVAGGAGFGVFEINTTTFSFYPFAMHDPHALDSSFSYGGMCMTGQGNIVVARTNGFSIASLQQGDSTLLLFPPVIQSITIGDKPFNSDTISSRLYNLYMDEREKDIALTLATPGNYASDPVLFQYWMEGYDKDWQLLQEGRSVRYTNVPRGQYLFHYRARLGEEAWQYGRPLSIQKEVLFYMKPWFYVLAGLILAGFVFLVYRLRIQRIRNEAKLKTEFNKRLADTEMAVLRSQMNPHFMFNSLNSIKYYILNEETDHANKYLTKFSKLMRLVLKNSQSRLVNLAEELEALKLYIELESLRFKEDFRYEIVVAEQIDQEDTYVPPLIIQPYVENAIWHGLLQKKAPGNLEVTIERKNGMVHVEVSDDGIGREAAEELRSKSATKKSLGTQITRDRITLVREIIGVDASVVTDDLRDESGKACGTRVIIEFPFINGHQMDDLELN